MKRKIFIKLSKNYAMGAEGLHKIIKNQIPPTNGIKLIKIHCQDLPISLTRRIDIDKLGMIPAKE